MRLPPPPPFRGHLCPLARWGGQRFASWSPRTWGGVGQDPRLLLWRPAALWSPKTSLVPLCSLPTPPPQVGADSAGGRDPEDC